MLFPINRANLHRFRQGDRLILLDVPSGSVHEIDQLVWDILDMVEEGSSYNEIVGRLSDRYSSGEITEALDELLQLAEEGLLSSEEEDLSHYAPSSDIVVKALCLHVAHDCNMRCRYCFADTGPFGGKRSLMSKEVGRKAVDFLLEHSAGRPSCEIDFFGGEPLMNMEVVQDVVEYGKMRAQETGKQFKFTLTTNGVALTPEIRDYLNQENISLVLSLDGRPETNDRNRKLLNGKSAYQHVLPRLKDMVASRHHDNYYVRGTYTRQNPDFAADVLHLVDQGFDIVSVEPVVGLPQDEYAIREEDLPQLFAEYDKLAEEYLARKRAGKPFQFFHFNIDLEGGPCLPKRLSGCGAGHEYMAVTPEGDLYPCHQFVGREAYRLGNVFTGIERPEIALHFKNSHLYKKEGCPTCWARYFCGGGCHANADMENGDIRKPYKIGCALQKKRIEAALYIKVKESAEKIK